MKILLVGEYSRLHNSLKEGLIHLGHQVVILGFNDGFKDYPVDFKLQKKWDSGLRKKVKAGIYRLTGFDIDSWYTYRQFFRQKKQFTSFDVVQLINENAFYCQPFFEKKILKFLFANNNKVFLLSCGDDYLNVKYYFEHPEVKSVIQPYLMGKIRDKQFLGVLKFRAARFKDLHDYLYKNIEGVIATDIDYHIPLIGHPKYLGLIPNPINIDKIKFQPFPKSDRITIFLGINNDSYFKKGNDYFEEALAAIREKFPGKTEVIVTRSIPYNRYIAKYDKSHILLDQTFSHDQGYNALEAMAKGKVVFTGAEPLFAEFYNLLESVNINAVPEVAVLVDALSSLIDNPAEIQATGERARAFIEKEHNYINVAGQYLETWK